MDGDCLDLPTRNPSTQDLTKGASLAAAADFLGNSLVVKIMPLTLKNIDYKTCIIFAVLNIFNAIIVWCLYPEAAGHSLESVGGFSLLTGKARLWCPWSERPKGVW